MINDDDFDCERDFEEEQANREDYRQMQEEEAAGMDGESIMITVSAKEWEKIRAAALEAKAYGSYYSQVVEMEKYDWTEKIDREATDAEREVCDLASSLFSFTDDEIESAVPPLDWRGILDEKNRTEVTS